MSCNSNLTVAYSPHSASFPSWPLTPRLVTLRLPSLGLARVFWADPRWGHSSPGSPASCGRCHQSWSRGTSRRSGRSPGSSDSSLQRSRRHQRHQPPSRQQPPLVRNLHRMESNSMKGQRSWRWKRIKYRGKPSKNNYAELLWWPIPCFSDTEDSSEDSSSSSGDDSSSDDAETKI